MAPCTKGQQVKKKHVLAPATLALALALAGCGSSGSAGTDKSAPADTESTQASASATEAAAASFEFPEASCAPTDEDSKESSLAFDKWKSAETDFFQISCEGVDLAKLASIKNGGQTGNLALKEIPEPAEIVDMSAFKFDTQAPSRVHVTGHIGPKAAASLATLDVSDLSLGDDGADVDLSAFKDNDFGLVSASQIPVDLKGFDAISADEKEIGGVGGKIKGEDVPADLPNDITITVDATSKGADEARSNVGANTYEAVVLKSSDKGTIKLAKVPDLDWHPGVYEVPDWLSGNTIDVAKYRKGSAEMGLGMASMDATIKVDGEQKKISHTIMVTEH